MRMVKLLSVVAALLVVGASTTSAALRVPQIPVVGPSLQAYLNGVGESINVLTDQEDAQVWRTSVSGNATFTLMIELTGAAGNNQVGIYHAGLAAPPLLQVFPPVATAGWFATCHFSGGNVVVTVFNQIAIIQGQTFYPGVPANNFGFYVSGPVGTHYSQDSRNPGGAARVLTYAGTGQNFGDWWECFDDAGGGFPNADSDFDDAVLLIQSVVPTPADMSTWGKIKSVYRK